MYSAFNWAQYVTYYFDLLHLLCANGLKKSDGHETYFFKTNVFNRKKSIDIMLSINIPMQFTNNFCIIIFVYIESFNHWIRK